MTSPGIHVVVLKKISNEFTRSLTLKFALFIPLLSNGLYFGLCPNLHSSFQAALSDDHTCGAET